MEEVEMVAAVVERLVVVVVDEEVLVAVVDRRVWCREEEGIRGEMWSRWK